MEPFFPFLGGMALRIESRNTFPHSSGIASSASSMSALALCLCGLEEKISGLARDGDFFRKASYMARLGSGSASRSVYGGFVQWGESGDTHDASNEYFLPVEIPSGSVFHTLRDSILIVSSDSKKVSSSRGHGLMEKHPYAGARYKTAALNLKSLKRALRSEDIPEFIRITESEAMNLHGLMFSSDPAVVLLQEGSLAVISRVRKFREETGAFLTYTIDAGPNIHLIYPDSQSPAIKAFIASELVEHCEEGKWIDDGIGGGPTEISYV